MTQSIFVNLDDDVKNISNKISAIKTGEVILVVPQGSRIFLDSINLKILKKHASQIGVKIALQTRDEKGLKYAEQNDLEILSAIPSKNVKPTPASLVTPKTTPKEEPVPIINPHLNGVNQVKRPILQSTVYKNPRDTRPENQTQVFEDVFIGNNQSALTKTQLLDHAVRVGERRKTWPKVLLILFVLFSISILGILYFYVLPEADISIYPKTQSLSRSLEVSANSRVKELDASHLTVPATSLEQTYDKTITFNSTGKKEVGTQSRGQVVIYNLTGNPISLKKSTTVLSVGNKLYYLDSDQDNIKSIPARLANDPKANLPDPISVVSQDGGSNGNQPAGIRLEITNQVFGNRPQTLYAKTVTPINGGESRYLSIVSEDDINTAKQKLQSVILDEIRQDLDADNYLLPDGAFSMDVQNFTVDQPVGAESVNFDAHISVRVRLLAISKLDVQKIVRDRLLGSLGQGEFLQDKEKDTMDLKVKNLDLENKTLSVLVDYSTTAFYKIAQKDLETDFSGKNVNDVQDYYLNNPQVDKVEIELKPSWQKKLPYFKRKIFLKVIMPE